MDSEKGKTGGSDGDISILGNIDVNIFKQDVRLLLTTVRRRWLLLLSIVLMVFCVALTYVLLYQKRQWTAQCVLFRHTNIELIQGELPNIYKPLQFDVILEMVRTKKNMREVIRRLHLNYSLETLFRSTAVERDANLRNENVFRIIAQAETGKEAADIANTLAELFLEEYVKTLNGSVTEIYNYYLESQALTNRTLVELEKEQQDYLTKYNVISVSSEIEGKFKQLHELEVQLLQAKMEANSERSRIGQFDEKLTGMPKDVPVSYEISSSDQAELDEMNRNLAKLKQLFTDENPRVLKLAAEIEVLKKKIAATTGKQAAPSKVIYGGNVLRSTVEEMRLKSMANLGGQQGSISQMEGAIAKLKEELNKLTKLEGRFYDITRRIQSGRDQQKKIDAMVSHLSFALKTNVSDIKIIEKAEPPNAPMSGKRKIIILCGLVFGVALALGLILLREIADFTVKSPFDLESVLGMKELGVLPPGDKVDKNSFYAAVQIIYKRITELCVNHPLPVLVSVGSLERGAGKSFVVEKLMEIMKSQGKKVLYISSRAELPEEEMELAINDCIYWDKPFDYSLSARNNHRVYFLLNDETFLMPIEKEMLPRFVSQRTGYDFIIWELFEFENNEQLFTTICEHSVLTALVTRFRATRKMAALKCVNFLKEHHCPNICGILNNVDIHYYNREI